MWQNKIQNSKFKSPCLPAGRESLLLFVLIFGFCIFSFAQEEFVYDAKNKRNPFIPLVTPDGRLVKLDREEEQGDILIEGIIYDKQGRSFAIINDLVVKIGDMVGEYQVLKIEETKVIFLKDGQAMEVRLKKKQKEEEE